MDYGGKVVKKPLSLYDWISALAEKGVFFKPLAQILTLC